MHVHHYQPLNSHSVNAGLDVGLCSVEKLPNNNYIRTARNRGAEMVKLVMEHENCGNEKGNTVEETRRIRSCCLIQLIP